MEGVDTAAPTFAPGSTFAGYRIESLAGRGGMGIVYRATQLALARPVALKLVASQYAADESFRERFKREWETAAAIDHPNVIPVYEAGEAQGHLFLAMRFVEGVDLANLIAREPSLDVGRAIRILAQIASALDAAHARGLVHRDVKPANILIGADDHAYLTDFGLSRGAEQSRMTRTGLFVGSTDFAAPEQIRGEATDARTDVYALGCVLFELLTRHVPFDRASDMAKMYAHITEPPPRVTAWRPDLPAALDEIVYRALAKEPDERYQSAGELARAAMTAIGLEARAPTPAPAPVAAPVRSNGWDTAPVGLASLPKTSVDHLAGSAPGWAATPAGGPTEAAAPAGAAHAAPAGAAATHVAPRAAATNGHAPAAPLGRTDRLARPRDGLAAAVPRVGRPGSGGSAPDPGGRAGRRRGAARRDRGRDPEGLAVAAPAARDPRGHAAHRPRGRARGRRARRDRCARRRRRADRPGDGHADRGGHRRSDRGSDRHRDRRPSRAERPGDRNDRRRQRPGRHRGGGRQGLRRQPALHDAAGDRREHQRAHRRSAGRRRAAGWRRRQQGRRVGRGRRDGYRAAHPDAPAADRVRAGQGRRPARGDLDRQAARVGRQPQRRHGDPHRPRERHPASIRRSASATTPRGSSSAASSSG